jgi:hypothetical protein
VILWNIIFAYLSHTNVLTPVMDCGTDDSKSRTKMSFNPTLKKVAGQYKCFYGPIYQNRPKLFPLTQTYPFAHLLKSR